MTYREVLKINKINTIERGSIQDFFRRPHPLFNLKNDNLSLERQIFNALMDPIIRRGDGILSGTTQIEYRAKIAQFVSAENPLEIVFLGLPFKCHNPIETLRKTPDLGELAFLLRLLDINETIKQVYEPGLHFTVLTEGNSYSHLFGATSDEVDKFEIILNDFIKSLEADEIIDSIDFKKICSNFSNFDEIRNRDEKSIRHFIREDKREIGKSIDVMTRSLPVIENIPITDLLKVYDNISDQGSSLNNYQDELKNYLLLGAEDLAVSYLAIQKAKNELGVIKNSFPDKLYFSTTSKSNRYSFHPIHRRTRIFPHHGVPILDSDKVGIVYFKEIIQNPQNFVAVFTKQDYEDAPFYFLKGRQHLKNL